MQFFLQVFYLREGRRGGLCRRFLRDSFFVLVTGGGFFIMLPSFMFYYIESGWTYLDSLYYTIITLSTIGLGDFTSSHHGYEYYHGYMLNVKLDHWVWAYRAFTLFWLVFGLSFFFMVNTFILNSVKKKCNIFREYRRSSKVTTEVWHHKITEQTRRKSV